ncbi:hypothetical protein CTI14_34870 [Methylobacterium radiotolerans]|nr:hypothetical protein CTI14_34870 [Methylobacterium radiotolerans]
MIINSGTISQGPANQNTAIKYAATAHDSTLVLQAGSEINGLVDARSPAARTRSGWMAARRWPLMSA